MKKAPTDDLLNKCILMLCDGAVDKLFSFFNNLILIFRGCLFTLLVLLFEATTTNKYYISLRKKYNLILMGLVIIHILHVILASSFYYFLNFSMYMYNAIYLHCAHKQCNPLLLFVWIFFSVYLIFVHLKKN